MTIDEKLSHFYDITVEEAHEKAAAILDEHKAALEKMAEEHKTLSEENAQTQIKAETASARREINKALSAEQLTIKRDWTRKQNELKEKIFSEVKGLLESFTKTPEYENYLTAKIKEALDFAGMMRLPSISLRRTDLLQRSFSIQQVLLSSLQRTLFLAVSALRFLRKTS